MLHTKNESVHLNCHNPILIIKFILILYTYLSRNFELANITHFLDIHIYLKTPTRNNNCLSYKINDLIENKHLHF